MRTLENQNLGFFFIVKNGGYHGVNFRAASMGPKSLEVVRVLPRFGRSGDLSIFPEILCYTNCENFDGISTEIHRILTGNGLISQIPWVI